MLVESLLYNNVDDYEDIMCLILKCKSIAFSPDTVNHVENDK